MNDAPLDDSIKQTAHAQQIRDTRKIMDKQGVNREVARQAQKAMEDFQKQRDLRPPAPPAPPKPVEMQRISTEAFDPKPLTLAQQGAQIPAQPGANDASGDTLRVVIVVDGVKKYYDIRATYVSDV